jgi:hypothetical protein
MPKTDLEKMRGLFKPYANGKTARLLIEEGCREEYIQDEKLKRMVLRYLERQRLQSKRGNINHAKKPNLGKRA